MVSAFIFFSDEAIIESKERLNSLNYILSPNGDVMTSVCIPPVDNLVMHLTDTFKSDMIVLKYSELVDNIGKEKVYSGLINIYSKTFGTILKDKDIDTWLSDNDDIYIGIDNNENINGYIRLKHLNINNVDENNLKYIPFVESNYFIYLSDIASIKKGLGRTLMNYLHYKILDGEDVMLRAHNKDLVPYYKQFGYEVITTASLKGNVMIRKYNEN